MILGCDQWEHCQTAPLVPWLWATMSLALSFSTSKLVLAENRRVFLPIRHIDPGETGRIYSHIKSPISPELNACVFVVVRKDTNHRWHKTVVLQNIVIMHVRRNMNETTLIRHTKTHESDTKSVPRLIEGFFQRVVLFNKMLPFY